LGQYDESIKYGKASIGICDSSAAAAAASWRSVALCTLAKAYVGLGMHTEAVTVLKEDAQKREETNRKLMLETEMSFQKWMEENSNFDIGLPSLEPSESLNNQQYPLSDILQPRIGKNLSTSHLLAAALYNRSF
jgi:hypothetical protein